MGMVSRGLLFVRAEAALAVAVLLLLSWLPTCHPSPSFTTGFWYSDTRPPITTYDSVSYANMSVKVNRRIDEGPGQNLLRDPARGKTHVTVDVNETSGKTTNTTLPSEYDAGEGLFVGNTINRETFVTQFVLDIGYALKIWKNRIVVVNIRPGDVHFSWESTSVIVQFIIMERNGSDPNARSLLEAVADLTYQIQEPTSRVYTGTNVTLDIDFQWGLQVVNWDATLKLAYTIENVGGSGVKEGYYLDQGGLGSCDREGAWSYFYYCEFERFFEDDVSRALNISYYRVQILFVRKAAVDAVLVQFRINPPDRSLHYTSFEEMSVSQAYANLTLQVMDTTSPLYKGNVTLRVDPTWGVSDTVQTPRYRGPLFMKKHYTYDLRRLNDSRRLTRLTRYDRCKQNRRCNWGMYTINQTRNTVQYWHMLFDRGQLYNVSLFLDFEEWRLGTYGFHLNGGIQPQIYLPGRQVLTNQSMFVGAALIRGAHFSPFLLNKSTTANVRAYGPAWQSSGTSSYLYDHNIGLVLDRGRQWEQVVKQQNLVWDLEGEMAFQTEHLLDATMDSVQRSRKDVMNNMKYRRALIHDWHTHEEAKLKALNTSQCTHTACYLTFNTTSLTLTGAITGTGRLMHTMNKTEVAVFTFHSIYLGPEVQVSLVGQRALVLMSRTSAVINTTFKANAGTLGGFKGGGIVGILRNQALSDHPRPIYICDLNHYCPNGTRIDVNAADTTNVNGPGSGNLRVFPFYVKTIAPQTLEIQTITTNAAVGQTISGSFSLRFRGHATPLIPANADEATFVSIAQTLNLDPAADRFGSALAGIGDISVTRSYPNDQGGYTWTVTFLTALGNVPQLVAQNHLVGIGANVTVATLQHGNQIDGSFTLSFQGYTTAPIGARESAAGMTQKLLALPPVVSAYILRTDPSNNCQDGKCSDGPLPSLGEIWAGYITVDGRSGDRTPYYPAQIRYTHGNTTGPRVKVDPSLLTGADVATYDGFGTVPARDYVIAQLNLTGPFSFAWGGAGGSYGGSGGQGYGTNPVGITYNDVYLSDLLGGSGGCARDPTPFLVNSFGPVQKGWGGSGGGAIEIVAANDIRIGTYGKILMRGDDGMEDVGGGGGGGSGGAVLLAAGGAVVNEGLIDVSGGSGGFAGSSTLQYAGGGGGGGRVAIYAESFSEMASGRRLAAGGPCGIYKVRTPTLVVVVNATLTWETFLPLGQHYVTHVGELLVNNTLAPLFLSTYNFSAFTPARLNMSDTWVYVQAVMVTLPFDTTYLPGATNVTLQATQTQMLLESTVGANLAELHMMSAVVTSYAATTITPVGAFPTNCSNPGADGSIYTETAIPASMYVNVTAGAEGTRQALFLSTRGLDNRLSSVDGPIISFDPAQPQRVTYYTRLQPVAEVSNKPNFGALFTLISRSSNLTAQETQAGGPTGNTSLSQVIGVFIGERIMYATNFVASFEDQVYLKRLTTLDDYVVYNTWYKVDLHLNWDTKMYYLMLNDVVVVKDVPFAADSFDGIRLSQTRQVDVWYDEIYVGFDTLMDYMCPLVDRAGVRTWETQQQGWAPDEITGYSKVNGHATADSGIPVYQPMMRHYSHLDLNGPLHFDGAAHLLKNLDLAVTRPLDGAAGDFTYPQHAAGGYAVMHAGALLHLRNTPRAGAAPLATAASRVNPVGLSTVDPHVLSPNEHIGRQFIYTEYSIPKGLNATNRFAAYPSLYGGIAACSSQDLQHWRFEGFVLHYVNLSDTVFNTNMTLALERPKVIFNALTQQYVMWAVMDEPMRSLAQTMTATSPYEDGPFFFTRSFYPDGNQTRDQVVFVNDEGMPVLARTYYQTVEYLLPAAIMQPIWESVKYPNGSVHFRNNFQRAIYDVGYDNTHDIYLQRWRKEDQPWSIQCVNKLTGESRPMPIDAGFDKNTAVNRFTGVKDISRICRDPEEVKVVVGQGLDTNGNPTSVASRFVSPNDSANSFWFQTSVPSVKAQPWAHSYRDGMCGIRKLNDAYDFYDPRLDSFTPPNIADCSNIVDNPVHVALQDKLIGMQAIVYTRRTKYVALSALSDDYLDTNGWQHSTEGEFEGGNLISFITKMGQFGFGAGQFFNTTFMPPVRSNFQTAQDYRYRFYQYMQKYNDRAGYALGCVLDGVCPVNYLQELTNGQV